MPKMASALSSDSWKNWEKSGKQEFVKSCAQLSKNEGHTPAFDNCGGLTNIFTNIHTLIEKGIKGSIKKESVVAALQEITILHSDIPSIICDVLNVADAMTSQGDGEDPKERENFCSIVRDCEKFLSEKLLKERLEIDTLQEVAILKNKTFYSKFIKIKTKLYYKQRKFNLFREECEGFAKLSAELNKQFSETTTHNELIAIVHSLIGCFNLDPNRVLDVILESFENKPKDFKVFVPLILSYMPDPNIISEVLFTKFYFLKKNERSVPQSLYILTAQLIQHNVIKLDDIYYWLIPDDKSIQKESDKNMKDAKEYVRKLQIISLNNAKDKEKEEPEEEKDLNQGENQKLGLCEAMILVGDWKNAEILIKRLPDCYAILHEPIAVAMCKLLHHIIESVYAQNCLLGTKLIRKPYPLHENPLAPKRANNYNDLFKFAFPILKTLGSSLHFEPVLLSKIVRLFKSALSSIGVDPGRNPSKNTDPIYYEIVTILDTTILPSLSYLECNCCVAEEIWSLLKLFPYQIRYCLYSRWKNETYSVYPDLMKKRADAEKQIKNIMKRVSKENVKPVGRLIGKLTHCAPGFLFDYVLLQIQVYNNLIIPVVDSLKYLTNLSYDVLGFCLIETLANADKKRTKHDSTSISLWLQSLSCFCGAVYKKYSIELTGLLQYVANQLKAQKSLDLLILKEVVQKMAGIDAAEDLTMEQLNALEGGDLLKGEAGYFTQVRNTKKSSQRLKEAMAEDDLAASLCLLTAQQSTCVVFREREAAKSHLKLVGCLSDQCRDALTQLGTFLGGALSAEEYGRRLPTIQNMLVEYHIPIEVAFFLARPMLNHQINQRYEQLRKSDPNHKKLTAQQKHQKYYDASQEVMKPVINALKPLRSKHVWEDISPVFVATFWQLQSYDLSVPEKAYQDAIARAKNQAAIANAAGAKARRDADRHQGAAERLSDEKKRQSEHVDRVGFRLRQEREKWFPAARAKNEAVTRFLQLCIWPRVVASSADAAFCARLIERVHALKTPGFSTILCCDRLFCDISRCLAACTEAEARRYGRFLSLMLETVSRWHSKKETFENECAGFPGFVTKYRVRDTAVPANTPTNDFDRVGYENYRHVCHKWHYKLAKAIAACLESKDYVEIRNALVVLIKILPSFPVLLKLAQFIERKVETVRDEEKDKRQDLFTLSGSYLGHLRIRVSQGKMLRESEFHIPVDKDKSKSEKSESGSHKHNGESKDEVKSEKKASKQSLDEKSSSKTPVSSSEFSQKEKRSEEKQHKDEPKEKYSSRKDEKQREDREDKDRDKERRRERREEKLMSSKEERRQEYREDRYIEMVNPKEESHREPMTSHHHREEMMAPQRSRSVEPADHPDRDVKRRKVDGTSSKRRIVAPESGPPRKERRPDDERELRKAERKLNRKRDRLDEGLQMEMKRRRDEEKAAKMLSHQNGELIEVSLGHGSREKHHRGSRELPREISPYQRERSHERAESREKHRRSTESKRR